MGRSIASGPRIGLARVNSGVMVMSTSARIGHLNLLRIRRLVMRPIRLGNMNICREPLRLRMGTNGSLGSRNTGARAPCGVTFGSVQLWLGRVGKVTSGHSLDCARSVRSCEYSTLSEKDSSQIWSQGYVHDDTGPGRYLIDGSVIVGSNIYIGSGKIIIVGVEICDFAINGVGASVTKNFTEPTFYVSVPLWMLLKPANPSSKVDMEHVTAPDLIESVYRKYIAHT